MRIENRKMTFNAADCGEYLNQVLGVVLGSMMNNKCHLDKLVVNYSDGLKAEVFYPYTRKQELDFTLTDKDGKSVDGHRSDVGFLLVKLEGLARGHGFDEMEYTHY